MKIKKNIDPKTGKVIKIPLSERNLPPGVLKSILQKIRMQLVEHKEKNPHLYEK